MATKSKFLDLTVPSRTDQFSTSDIAANWNALDRAPGVHVCTSSTRPNWNQAKAGRLIYETDTDLMWAWTGSAWSRVAPKGILNRSDGSKAIAQRHTDFSTTSTTPAMILGVSNVVVPPGHRPLMVTVTWSRAYATTGYFYGRIHRHSGAPASNSGTTLMQWAINGDKRGEDPASRGGGGTYVTYEPQGLPAGVYGFSFQTYINPAHSGTATVTGSAGFPSQIAVVEL